MPSVTGMVTQLHTEGDLDRGHPPDRKMSHWSCSIVDPDSGAVCTLRPHGEDKPHVGIQAVEGSRRATRTVSWTGGAERAMVVDGYTWTRIPGTDFEVRALSVRPLALRYQPMHPRGRGPRA